MVPATIVTSVVDASWPVQGLPRPLETSVDTSPFI